MRLASWRKPQRRRQASPLAPAHVERVDWRTLGIKTSAVLAVLGVALLLRVALDRPVRRVLVQGSFQRVSAPEIESVVTKAIDGGLASVDLVAVRREVEKIPWVDEALVSRQWPDAIRVTIAEEIAAARWNDTGLLNTRGELFIRNARFVPPELPSLEGPEGSEGEVAKLYLEAQGPLLEAGLRLTGVRLDARGAWELRLGDGVVVRLGRQSVDERLERFITLASATVAKRIAEISYIDMRYTNGFSVGWNGSQRTSLASAS
jgi:cell division protein FtsQ